MNTRDTDPMQFQKLTFGAALALIKTDASYRLWRAGWNGNALPGLSAGPRMWLRIQWPDDNSKMSLPYIYMRTVQGDRVPWLASQTDILSDDWCADYTPYKEGE